MVGYLFFAEYCRTLLMAFFRWSWMSHWDLRSYSFHLGSFIHFMLFFKLCSYQLLRLSNLYYLHDLRCLICYSRMFSIKSKRTEKPMQLSDYRRIENELQQQIKQATISHVPGESLSRKGWSTGCLGTNRNKTSEIVAYWFALFMIIRY